MEQLWLKPTDIGALGASGFQTKTYVYGISLEFPGLPHFNPPLARFRTCGLKRRIKDIKGIKGWRRGGGSEGKGAARGENGEGLPDCWLLKFPSLGCQIWSNLLDDNLTYATCPHQKSNFYIPGSKVWTLSAHIITVPSDSIVGALKDIMESRIAHGLTVCRLYEVRQASESVSIDPAVNKGFLASACQKAHGPNQVVWLKEAWLCNPKLIDPLKILVSRDSHCRWTGWWLKLCWVSSMYHAILVDDPNNKQATSLMQIATAFMCFLGLAMNWSRQPKHICCPPQTQEQIKMVFTRCLDWKPKSGMIPGSPTSPTNNRCISM